MIHGEVKINHNNIIEWKAENEGPTTVPGRYTYAVKAKGYLTNGYPFNSTFEVTHDRNDGPFMLTSIIMQELYLLAQPVV